MSNPTPILNNINAFDVTKGTTISFNIIGGTDIVRSNIAYIYDLSTNDLICTHLYISTESIHELPPNTDPSIVYASGKSSADFVNNKNYYLQIQTFTNTAGTAGGSGMSVAKTFWCLFNPALSVNAIPAAISTTSYNVGATYTTNITDATIPVTNIIQQYKFDLYTATGTLVQTSGNIIGSGEQEGTSTTYNITYNFSGLVVNNSYYVIVTTTSTEGMTVSAQSNTFAVSIETPTVGGAIVNNNACDGYISVVSNLSDEYGGSASGEMASFETDSVNNVSSLKVNMEPIQDLHGYDKPWVGGAGRNLLNVGGRVNQTSAEVKYTSDDNYIILNGTKNGGGYATMGNLTLTLPAGTYYARAFAISGTTTSEISLYVNNGTSDISGSLLGTEKSFTLESEATLRFRFAIWNDGTVLTNYTVGTVVSTTSGIDKFYPYSNICPINGRDSVGANVVGKNIFGGRAFADGIKTAIPQAVLDTDAKTISYASGYATSTSNFTSGVQFKENTQYTIILKFSNTVDRTNVLVAYTDGTSTIIRTSETGLQTIIFTSVANKTINYIGGSNNNGTSVFYYEECGVFEGVLTADQFETYTATTYTTDLNQTVYGGTLDLVTGVLTVDRVMANMGTLTWLYSDGLFRAQVPNFAEPSSYVDRRMGFISSAYSADTQISISAESMTDGTALRLSGRIYTKDTRFTDPTAFKTAVTGQTLCYELATPQTYQLTPHQIQTLVGQNNVWSDAGDVEVTFNLPISNLLVKRQDASDVSGNWLTLYSQPITQASDMDFTYIDFLNQHGKTYKYALVPLLTQQQGDIDVEIEGGYTVSDDVLSVFDGVFVANNNGSQKLKAATEYGDLETNQDVGVLTTIGGKYPFVVSNSNLNYHSGSISALIVPSDFYTNGDLDRLDIVERREAIEQFLTDKTAKILKDWNGNIWLITFVENVEVSFVDDYGMGLGTLSAKWVEIGDVNDQTDLKQTGLI